MQTFKGIIRKKTKTAPLLNRKHKLLIKKKGELALAKRKG
jgi:hypothetical protein